MRSCNRYEVLGIVLSLAVAIGTLGFTRFASFSSSPDGESADKSALDIIFTDPKNKDKQVAFARAITEGSDHSGRVLKLIADDTKLGVGREARIGDTITMHYSGMVKDGPVFDNSYKQGKPFSFKMGADEVIEGLEKGIIGMKEGGTRTLIVPPEMGYGNTIVDPLPANATLLFVIELLSIE